MRPSSSNPTCAGCELAINTISGRYCKFMNRSVEYDDYPPCEKKPEVKH